jgi:hypothetical protein
MKLLEDLLAAEKEYREYIRVRASAGEREQSVR